MAKGRRQVAPHIRLSIDLHWREQICYPVGVMSSPEVPTPLIEQPAPAAVSIPFVPIPSNGLNRSIPSAGQSSFTPLVGDQRAINRLLESIIHRAGKTVAGVAKELGTSPNNVSQYINGRRAPGLMWFLKVCAICGVAVKIDLPPSK